MSTDFNYQTAKLTVGRMWADNCMVEFVDSLAELLLYSQKRLCGPNEFIHYIKAPMSYHEMARNWLVEHMEGEWLLSLDTDHMFRPDLLERLLLLAQETDSKVVSAIYQYKSPSMGHRPVANMWDEEGKLKPIMDWDKSGRFIEGVGPCGAGALLVHHSVFKKMRAKFQCEPFVTIPGLSEDYSFFKRLQEMGEKAVLGTTIEAHHMIRTALSVRDL